MVSSFRTDRRRNAGLVCAIYITLQAIAVDYVPGKQPGKIWRR
jgi:hypothetical protein